MSRKLRAQAGTDQVNFGTERFIVNTDGTVDVPDEAVETLIGVGGFEEIVSMPELPEGSVSMRSTIGPMSVSVGGQSYETGANDIVNVPLHAVGDLYAHGLVLVSDVAAPAAEPESTPEQKPPVEALPTAEPQAATETAS